MLQYLIPIIIIYLFMGYCKQQVVEYKYRYRRWRGARNKSMIVHWRLMRILAGFILFCAIVSPLAQTN